MMTNVGNVSWLALERYALGELPEREKARIEQALQSSAELLARLEQIRSEQGLPLRPLPEIVPRARARLQVLLWEQLVAKPIWRRPQLWTGATAAIAACFAAVMVVRNISDQSAMSERNRVKGELLQLNLVKQSGNTDTSVFAQSDAFKIRVTCSRPAPVPWQVSIFQGNEVFFPLTSTEPLRCGNNVILPGAFRLTGNDPVIICLGLGDAVVPPELLRREGIRALPATATCTTVRPLPEP